jgi:hypothetical protein
LDRGECPQRSSSLIGYPSAREREDHIKQEEYTFNRKIIPEKERIKEKIAKAL